MPFHAGDYQVEAVKSANGRLTRGTSLRGACVHIFELPELGAIARTAENGDAVLPCRRLRGGTKTDFGGACQRGRGAAFDEGSSSDQSCPLSSLLLATSQAGQARCQERPAAGLSHQLTACGPPGQLELTGRGLPVFPPGSLHVAGSARRPP